MKKPGYQNEPGFGRPNDSKIYIGVVKNNSDVQKMGRLAVYIPEFGGDPLDSDRWFIVSYASPFAGVSNIDANVNGSQSMAGSQVSYGMWFVPPDLNNEVLVTFANGEPTKGFWFACVWQQNMNHMVPGIASNVSFSNGQQGILPPVTEYNKKDGGISPNSPTRPRFEPLHRGLLAQGLYSDFERGPTDASARRESPSKVYGFLTPRGNQLYIDDDLTNEFMRFRTRSGVQILVHETNGYIYMNTKNGNSWLEISDNGINAYTAGSFNVRAEQDINFRADRNINLDAGLNLNMKAGTDILQWAGSGIHSTGMKVINQSTTTHNMKADSIFRDGMIYDNIGNAADAATPGVFTRSDRKGTVEVTVSVMPTHEPWDGHPRSTTLEPPQGDVPGQVADIKGTGGQLTDVPPGTPKESAPQTKEQRTGEGEVKDVEYDAEAEAKKVKVGAYNVSEAVIAAIRRACEITSVDFGFMMAMAEKESSFDPNAIPLNKKTGKTYSSAKGLYQILDRTWDNLFKSYGAKYNITNNRFDPFSNALMAAFLTKENGAALKRYGVSNPTNTHLYMAHFAGPYTAAKLILGDSSSTGVSVVGSDAANANPWIFFDKGTPKSVGAITNYFRNFIEPRSIAYRTYNPTA